MRPTLCQKFFIFLLLPSAVPSLSSPSLDGSAAAYAKAEAGEVLWVAATFGIG